MKKLLLSAAFLLGMSLATTTVINAQETKTEKKEKSCCEKGEKSSCEKDGKTSKSKKAKKKSN